MSKKPKQSKEMTDDYALIYDSAPSATGYEDEVSYYNGVILSVHPLIVT